ncbi:MAG: radical activating enzyme family protein [Zetaproteobacteria bacterium CG_4_10_14_0_2_um_filter_55_20]|nr:MAG: radical activating enzyme family protein [Zetaproteobacteria bacterium CG1_02_55_237]PIS18802.1 MAG: radical activating enzyme family protein [Zetaproteobacteria bacterium CG08_land_8_20_14_0_20_55_17]PIY54483.1 MAG: radical activating enzyme family protein [Zetaproteobacteria bacterium CG_4_10_14_0_8_um_filter_55_43]PIZ38237.1 MAG: radical activating enzyme family protein [Zetaproteobacteria bacterium CG_4_10_14_0_2_um_filter_55_20]PJB82389.1 MAG: radical activating enzyme family prote
MSVRARVRIHEIYDCIQGESTLAGMPCTLVRLAGCPLNCTYCDTPEAIPFDSGEWMNIADIVAEVSKRKRPLTLVSGGEPLAQKGCARLLEALADVSPLLQLETSGSFDIGSLHPAVRRIIDIKTPDSGEESRNRWENIAHLKSGDELKIVLCSRADYAWALQTLSRLGNTLAQDIPVLFSPVESRLPATDLAEWMLQDNPPARLQLQMHKHIWGAEATHV